MKSGLVMQLADILVSKTRSYVSSTLTEATSYLLRKLKMAAVT
jgi:hypothetical protein